MFRGKYFAGMLAAYITVFVIGFYITLPLGAHIGITAAFLFIFALSIFVKKRRAAHRKRRILIFLLAVVLFVFSFGYSEWFARTRIAPASAFKDGEHHAVCGIVQEVRYEKSYASAYVLSDISIDGKALNFGALLDIPFAGELSIGDEIAFESVIDEISDGYEYYQKSQGILISLASENFTRTGGEAIEPSLFARLREKITENFEMHIGKGAAYASALLIGDRTGLSGQTKLAYQRLGISHVLAVSGMHFSVIVGGIDLLLRVLTVPKKRKNIFLILFSLLFAAVCGFSASIARAVIMFCIYYIADSIGEKSDSLTSLFFASACIITLNPWAVYDAGLWLSVLSTLGIILVMPSMKSFLEKKKEINIVFRLGKRVFRAFLCMTVMNLTSIFFTMPVTYLLYGGISLISPFANMIFIPLTELILYLLVILTLLGSVPFLGAFLGEISGFLIEIADKLALSLSNIRGIYVSIRYPFAVVILVALVLGILGVLFAGEFQIWRMLAVFLVSALAFGIAFAIYHHMDEDSTYLYLSTDGRNDVLGVVDDGEVMLIDVTNGGRHVPQMAVETLSDYYRCEIDTYLVTHLHSYHAGTLKVLADEIKIHRILLPEAETEKDTEYINAIIEALDGASEIVLYKRDGTETAEVGDTVLTLPDYETITRSEHPALVFSAETDGVGAWIYCGASSMEFAEHWQDVTHYRAVIFGAHGPAVKNIFDDDCLSMAELVLFSSSDTRKLVNEDKINGKLVSVEEEYHIRFEH